MKIGIEKDRRNVSLRLDANEHNDRRITSK